jgi:hypothetical protein
MNESLDISALEQRLGNPTIRLLDQVKEDTKRQLVPTQITEAQIAIHATIRTADDSSVVRVSTLSLQDLYGEDLGPVGQFAKWLSDSTGVLNELAGCDENDIEFEVISVRVWRTLSACSNFTGISAHFNEFSAAVQQLVCAESAMPMTQGKLRHLKLAFDSLRKKPWLSDAVLDEFYDALESGGFDLNYAMSFAPADNAPT